MSYPTRAANVVVIPGRGIDARHDRQIAVSEYESRLVRSITRGRTGRHASGVWTAAILVVCIMLLCRMAIYWGFYA